MNLAGPLRYWSRRSPDRVFFVMDGHTLTWHEVHERTSSLAQGLAGLAVANGDRVALLTTNCIEFCEAVLACFKLGAIVVPVNYRLAPPEIAEILRRSGTSMVLGHADLLAPLVDHVGAGRTWSAVVIGAPGSLTGLPDFDSLIADSPAIDPLAQFEPQHPAFICYTSGTTGIPKGAVLSHRNVMATAMERMTCDEWNTTTIGYIPYAIAFTGGLVCMWMPLYVAGSKVVLDASFDPERALRVIAEERITAYIAVGSVLIAMAASPDFADADFSSLRTLATGGTAIPVELIRQYERKGILLAQQYGLTEGGGLNLMLPPDQSVSRIGSTGLPTPQCQARVVDLAGTECAVDEVGELVLRGPQCMERYWEDEEETAKTIVDGWLHTGDLARVDADGYFEIVDRLKDMLISGGLNIYPAEIERVLAAFEPLEEVAVIAVAHPRWGQVPVVIGRARTPTSEEAILEFCRQQLGRYKVPKRAILRAEPLPRGMSNKVLKRVLRDEYAELDVGD